MKSRLLIILGIIIVITIVAILLSPLIIEMYYMGEKYQGIDPNDYDLENCSDVDQCVEWFENGTCSLMSSKRCITERNIESETFDNITLMEPNSVELFYYPTPSEDQDTYKLFMLIRLPEWMGGGANDTSAYRVYSAKSLDDSCVVRYWPDEGRQRIENPCQGGMYRVIDGALTYGAIHRSTAMTGLPYLDLSIDENGMMYVEPPKFTPSENGAIGYGRNIPLDEIRNNSAFLVESFAKHYSDYPQIPVTFGGYILSEISPEKFSTTVRYLDFPNKSGYFEMTVEKFANGIVYSNSAKQNLEYWQIGKTVITIGGSAMDEDSDRSESFRTYQVDFSDVYHYRIEGKNLEFIKKSIVESFFPEYDYDDLFLVSSTVK
jgi:hypothetical protein